MENILRRITALYDLPSASLNKLTGLLRVVELPKGYRLFEADRVESDIYFIEKGMARAFCYSPDNEITFWFGSEGDIVLSYNSYVNQQPGYENVELLEDSQLYTMKTRSLQALYSEDIAIANWGRKMAEQELIRTEERFISRQFKTATIRYQEMLEQTPQLIQRVQLCHIASYLGVTQVTLSRIRAGLR